MNSLAVLLRTLVALFSRRDFLPCSIYPENVTCWWQDAPFPCTCASSTWSPISHNHHICLSANHQQEWIGTSWAGQDWDAWCGSDTSDPVCDKRRSHRCHSWTVRWPWCCQKSTDGCLHFDCNICISDRSRGPTFLNCIQEVVACGWSGNAPPGTFPSCIRVGK